MKEWDERLFSYLQSRIETVNFYDRVGGNALDDGCFTLMTAYLLGVQDALTGDADEFTLSGIEE